MLEGPRPRLLDEWQLVPALWDHVRRAVDDAQARGQFILTGSSTPTDDARRHSGAGRFSTLRMRPMSVHEAGASSDEVSVAALFEGEPARGRSGHDDLRQTLDHLVTGGWPLQVTDPTRGFARDYLDQIVHVDVQQLGPRRDPDRLTATIQSLARNTATPAGDATIARDVGIDRDTVAAYVDALRRLLIVEDLPAFATHLRSSRRLRTTPVRHFVDPSLAVAALQADVDALVCDLELTGLLFESMVVRDLRVLAAPLDIRVTQFRTDANEIDAVLQTPDGRWAGVEVKLGGDTAVDAGAASLLSAAGEVRDTPAFLAVVTANGRYAYRRGDDIDVIPLAALAP